LPRPSFFKVVIHEPDTSPALTGLCAGYESRVWRASALADHLTESLPEFCLTHRELELINPANAVQLLRESARRVYQTRRFENRGEFGELLLHCILKEVLRTESAICKIYYKDSANNTVKGFDAVHVAPSGNQLELWLGEAKLHESINTALASAQEDLRTHTTSNYLRAEFLAITGKIDPTWPHADRLRLLIDPRTSLDQVFDVLCIPVLLTYDGGTTANHDCWTDQYFDELEAEFRVIYDRFAAGDLPSIAVHLILIPLKTKADLLRELDQRLRSWQTI
jgi:uncharacterized protein DUF1837